MSVQSITQEAAAILLEHLFVVFKVSTTYNQVVKKKAMLAKQTKKSYNSSLTDRNIGMWSLELPDQFSIRGV